MTPTREEVLGALAGVRDPELDEPITALGFVSGVDADRATVSVTLRLPTFFCSPNFAYMMAADAKEALLKLPLVEKANVFLADFHVSEEINAGVGSRAGFDHAFSGFTDETSGDDLAEVRDTFRRKAFVRRQEMLARALMREGATPAQLANTKLGEVGPSSERDVYLERRAELGFDVSEGSPLLLGAQGSPVPEEAVVAHLKHAKLTRISVEGNGMFCQELLHARYSKTRERLGA